MSSNFFTGTQIRLSDGRFVDAGEHVRGKIVVLYFSASWCAPCRSFTPIMKDLYTQINATNQPIEIILLPRDYMRFQLDEYLEKHGITWAVAALRDPIIEKCMDFYRVEGLPDCRVVDEWGETIDDEARKSVMNFTKRFEQLFTKWRQAPMIKSR